MYHNEGRSKPATLAGMPGSVRVAPIRSRNRRESSTHCRYTTQRSVTAGLQRGTDVVSTQNDNTLGAPSGSCVRDAHTFVVPQELSIYFESERT
jgi:hypothetical protein